MYINTTAAFFKKTNAIYNAIMSLEKNGASQFVWSKIFIQSHKQSPVFSKDHAFSKFRTRSSSCGKPSISHLPIFGSQPTVWAILLGLFHRLFHQKANGLNSRTAELSFIVTTTDCLCSRSCMARFFSISSRLKAPSWRRAVTPLREAKSSIQRNKGLVNYNVDIYYRH